MTLVLLERRHLVNSHDLAIYAHTRKALVADVVDHVFLLPLAVAYDRGQHHEPCALIQSEHAIGDLLHALAGDLHAALRAVRDTNAGVEHSQVVVDLGDRRHGGPRVTAGGLLVDRDGRGQTLDVINVGLVHLPEELPGVRGETLHVAPLPLRVQGVERKARLAAAGQAGDDRQLIPGDLNTDVLEVVLAGTNDADGAGAIFGSRTHCAHGNPTPPRSGLRSCTRDHRS